MIHPKWVVGSELGCFARAVSTLGLLSLLSKPLKKEFFFKVTEEMKTFLLCPFCFLGYTYRMVTTQHLSIGLTMAFPCPFLCVFYCAVILLFQPQREHQLLGEAFMTLTVLCPLLETVCFLLYHFVGMVYRCIGIHFVFCSM